MKNTIFFVSHDMGVHFQITHKMLIMYAAKVVEFGATDAIFANPLHPYTKMLIESLPTIGDEHLREGVSGRPPSLWEDLHGCRFASRCPLTTELCRTSEPEFKEVLPGHFVACHYATGSLSSRKWKKMTTILKTENLTKVYKLGGFIRRATINALDDVNLKVQSDKPVIISLVGESGSGKTTLAKVILQLVAPTCGSAVVYDRLVAGKGEKPGRQQFLSTVQPIFQNPFESFSSHRTVDTYLTDTATSVNRLNQTEADEAVAKALTHVGLEYADVKGKYPNQFSGGELQRVSIARALIPDPEIIVADEPVSMIDASLRMNIINLFLSLKEEYNEAFSTLPMTWQRPITSATILPSCIGGPSSNSVMPRRFSVTRNIRIPNCSWPPSPKPPTSGVEKKMSRCLTSRPRSTSSKDVGSTTAARWPKRSANMTDRPATLKEDGREVYCHFA